MATIEPMTGDEMMDGEQLLVWLTFMLKRARSAGDVAETTKIQNIADTVRALATASDTGLVPLRETGLLLPLPELLPEFVNIEPAPCPHPCGGCDLPCVGKVGHTGYHDCCRLQPQPQPKLPPRPPSPKTERCERNKLLDAVSKWVAIRSVFGPPLNTEDAERFAIDARKSALLRRLQSGKAPLPEPPPRAYSYPWYKLADEGTALASEVFVHGSSLVIEQMEWAIVGSGGAADWLVRYRYLKNGVDVWAKDIYAVRPADEQLANGATQWRVTRLGAADEG